MSALINFRMVMPFTLSGVSGIFEGLIDKIFPSGIWPLITQLLATGIMIFIVYKLLYNPMKKFLAKRASYIQTNIEGAALSNRQAAIALKDAQESVIMSKVEAQAIIKAASEDSARSREALILEAEREITESKVRAQEEIASSKDKALDEIHQEIVSVALAASKQVLGREINEKDNARLVDDFIREARN
ncbi:MAG: F0F1 ATP synthase subunit B [Firmicutes bacterium]|nr:F0F1 ATP synthase subunit B [Bacillota bacterium]